ncbi:MAG: MarR family winged helix-turn-helix transcriptional regulator, partial [Acidimicrobiales bacterium]
GLSPPQGAVLRGIAEVPGCSRRALARHLGADPMNIKRCVDDLEGRGLIQSGRRPGDRRPRTLALTEAGTTTTAQVDRLARAQQDRLAGAVTPAEGRALGVGLARLESLLGLGDAQRASTQRASTQRASAPAGTAAAPGRTRRHPTPQKPARPTTREQP